MKREFIKLLAIHTICYHYHIDFERAKKTIGNPRSDKVYYIFLKRYQFFKRIQLFIDGYIWNVIVNNKHTTGSFTMLIEENGLQIKSHHPAYAWWDWLEIDWG